MASSRKPGPADPRGHVRDILLTSVRPDARLCLGYSGGLDSAVLLHVLAELAPEIGFCLTAVHVHHGLSTHADEWAEFCRRTCAHLAVPLAVQHVRVVAEGGGIEAAARAARYQAFATQDADHIVLAHQRDDQAETFLLRLLRGAGSHGLASMRAERPLNASRGLLRPLLDVPRRDLAAYAEANGVAYINDESNDNLDLDRNWLRHTVLPLLAGRFPACHQVLARNAALLAEDAELLDQLARQDLAGSVDDNRLNLAALGRLDERRARNLLRYWLADVAGVTLNKARLHEIWRQLMQAGPDRWPAWPLGTWVLSRQHGHAVLENLTPARQDVAGEGEWVWRGEPELVLGEHGRLVFELVRGGGVARRCLPDDSAQVAWRKGGERLRPDCRRPRRALKNWLREQGWLPGQRGSLPLLRSADRLVWVAGVGIECGCQARPDETGWLIEWRPSGQAGR